MARTRNFLYALLLFAAVAAANAQTAAAWPQADRLFHSDPQWLGADVAFSIDLGHGRVLWLFGDTFVAHKPGQTRSHAAFVRNTAALENGYDPSHASLRFYWRNGNHGGAEFFPSEGSTWMWPGGGIRMGNSLILFASRIAPNHAAHSLGFRLVGWLAYRVANPDAEPSAWKLEKVVDRSDNVILASAVLRQGDFVYLFGAREPDHDVYLARLSVAAAELGNFTALEWWSGSGWQSAQSERRPVISSVSSEFSVQRDPRGSGFLEFNSQGFGATDIVMRRAPALEGPWSTPEKVYRPPESNAPDAFVYAGKSHPELTGADVVLTYAANGTDQKVATDMSLYFPRFVKVTLPKTVVASSK